MELTSRIIEILKKSGLTPSEFADKIGVQRSAISHITSGRNNPSLEFLIKIKNAFPEIDTDWLIFGEEKKEMHGATPTLFNYSNSNENKTDLSQKSQQINKPLKKIERVVLFYEDGTFEDFSQSTNL